MGTHDLDTVQGPFAYKAHAPSDINFAPLGAREAVRGDRLKAHMDEHRPTISKYFPLLRADKYPLIWDASKVSGLVYIVIWWSDICDTW